LFKNYIPNVSPLYVIGETKIAQEKGKYLAETTNTCVQCYTELL